MGAASAIREGPDLMFVFKFCTYCGGCMSTGLGLILSQEYAYLGRESLHRIHWVLVHTMNNDAFMRCNAFQSAHCPPIRIYGTIITRHASYSLNHSRGYSLDWLGTLYGGINFLQFDKLYP
ncbi:hypothetical protein Peur_033940 [Populus x canadensis]